MRIKQVMMGLLAFCLAGCGERASTADNQPAPATSWSNRAPALRMATPGTLVVGETLDALGKDFIDPARGRVLLRFRGSYRTTTGASQQVSFSTEAQALNSGRLAWRLWPDIVFDSRGDQPGTFTGTVTAINREPDGTGMESTELPLTLVIGASIIPRKVQPELSTCKPLTSTTLERTSMELAVEAVGLGEGHQSAPLSFSWWLPAAQWSVSFEHQGKAVSPAGGTVQIIDAVRSGALSEITTSTTRTYHLEAGGVQYPNARIIHLRTAQVPADRVRQTAYIVVEAQNHQGHKTRLMIHLELRRKADLIYLGKTKIKQRYTAMRVTGCIPGGDQGRDVVYAEDKSETRARSLSVSYNGMQPGFPGLPSNPFMLGINFSTGFGKDVNAEVSSSSYPGLTASGRVPANHYGCFYRQTVRVVHVGQIRVTSLCGSSHVPGEVQLTDWRFVGDLGSGPHCPPPTNLPAAKRYD